MNDLKCERHYTRHLQRLKARLYQKLTDIVQKVPYQEISFFRNQIRTPSPKDGVVQALNRNSSSYQQKYTQKLAHSLKQVS